MIAHTNLDRGIEGILPVTIHGFVDPSGAAIERVVCGCGHRIMLISEAEEKQCEQALIEVSR